MAPPTECTGKWFLQLAAGGDRDGLRGVVDKVRAADSKYEAASLYVTEDGQYRVAIGCFPRFEADTLKDEFVARAVMRNEPLVTRGDSLRAIVY